MYIADEAFMERAKLTRFVRTALTRLGNIDPERVCEGEGADGQGNLEEDWEEGGGEYVGGGDGFSERRKDESGVGGGDGFGERMRVV